MSIIINPNSRNINNHHFGRPVMAGDNPNTTGHLLDSRHPRKPRPRAFLPGAAPLHPLGALDGALGNVTPERPGVLGGKITHPRQPGQQQSGPTAAEEGAAYRQNRNLDRHDQRMADAQDAVGRMATQDRARTRSSARDYMVDLGHEVQVMRQGIDFDGNGDGFGPTGIPVFRNPNPPAAPMAARNNPDDPSSPAAMRRIPKSPSPFAGANPISMAEPAGFGQMSGAGL